MLRWFWIIPLLPLLGAAINGLAGKKLPRRVVHTVACGTVLLAFVLSLASFMALRGDLHELQGEAGLTVDAEARRVEHTLAAWIPGDAAGTFQVDWGFTLDPLSVVMILVVTAVGFLIHVYSIGYMKGDPGYARYCAYLNLFTGMMLILVLGSSLLVLFVGWEGVGLCSYLLIGFWYTDLAKATAGMKAFLVNRIGDFGFLIGMMLLFAHMGTLNIQEVLGGVEGSFLHETALLTAVGLCLFVGAAGKSAQLPLSVCLAEARLRRQDALLPPRSGPGFHGQGRYPHATRSGQHPVQGDQPPRGLDPLLSQRPRVGSRRSDDQDGTRQQLPQTPAQRARGAADPARGIPR